MSIKSRQSPNTCSQPRSQSATAILPLLNGLLHLDRLEAAFGLAAAWIIAAMGSLVLVIALAQVVTAPRMMAIGRALATEKVPLSQIFYSLANHPLLWISIQTRVAIALGIVFLKTAKPDLGGSLITIGVAIILGLASALPMPRRERTPAGLAD